MIDYGADLQYAKLLPEFAKLQAILGRSLRDTDSWAPYARLVALHGWKRLIRAAEQADPDKRWAPDLEKWCNQFAKDEAEANAQPPPVRVVMTREQREARAKEFQQLRERIVG